jgi:hypothetical protein
MAKNDDMRDVIAREAESDDGAERTVGIALERRPVNNIDRAIGIFMDEEPLKEFPLIFLEPTEDGSVEHDCWMRDRQGNRLLQPEIERWFGREVTAGEIMNLHKELANLVMAKYRPHYEVAMALGPTNRWGGPTEEQYIAACKAVGLEPLPLTQTLKGLLS